MKVSAIQMISGPDPKDNFSKAEALLERAAKEDVDIAVVPENFLAYGQKIKPNLDEQRAFLDKISRLAKSLNIWLVAGSHPLNTQSVPGVIEGDVGEEQADVDSSGGGKEGGGKADRGVDQEKPYAASVVVDREGRLKGAYLKVHLFDALVGDSVKTYRESDEYASGHEAKVFDSPMGRFGVTVCYDLRFPEMFIQLARRGADVIFVPSAFTEVTGRAHWEVLLRARAIESQCYVVAANQGGKHEKGRSTWGHSMIVDPWGEVLDSLEFGEGLLVQNLDMEFLRELRHKMPVQHHRKLI